MSAEAPLRAGDPNEATELLNSAHLNADARDGAAEERAVWDAIACGRCGLPVGGLGDGRFVDGRVVHRECPAEPARFDDLDQTRGTNAS